MSTTRKVRKKPLPISYEEFRTTAGDGQCACSGPGGAGVTELAILVVRQLTGTEPAVMLEQLFEGQETVPVHGVWHHVLVGEILLVCLRNAGYPISEALIDEVIDRGQQIPGGSCGFIGVCGALASSSAAYAVLLGATPVATPAREKLLVVQAKLMARLAELGESRCCKKSAYCALELSYAAFTEIGFELPQERFEGRCPFHANNDTCDGATCPYFPES